MEKDKDEIWVCFKMNAKQKQITIKNSWDLLDPSFHRKVGIMKVNAGNTIEHEVAKVILLHELKGMKKSVVCEAIFKNGKRADLFVLDDCEAYEVVVSEKEKSLKKKEKSYPCDLLVFEANAVIGMSLK